jgi:cell division transport system permease protein
MGGPALDLPLDDAPAGRFLLWITAGLVYLAVLGFGIAAVADRQLGDLQRQPRIVTVALPPNPDPAAARMELLDVLELLRTRPGVAYASVIDDAEIDSLVQPWLGGDPAPEVVTGSLRAGMPLPRLIDIAYNPGAPVDLAALDRDLAAVAQGAAIGDAGLLQRNQERIATTFRRVGIGIGFLLLALTTTVAVMVCRINLTQHAQAVDLLRLMGAKDRYIAQQLEHHALGKTLRGALVGFALGLSTIALVLHGPPLVGQSSLTEHGLAPVHWVLLGVVPIATALAGAIATRLAALFGLARLG